jgi:dolichol-phosphate mannosyltransferase
MKLSIIMPVYNEANTIKQIVGKINRLNLKKELIIVDDGSVDQTREYLRWLERQGDKNIKIIYQAKNYGKGLAIRTGLKQVSGDIVIIQDADLEYDPADYNKLINPIKAGLSKVVYGSRNLSNNPAGRKLYRWGGIFLSWLTNLLYGTAITDEATCYKVFKTEVIKNLNLKCRRFEFCPEVTAKLAKQGYRIMELPISYCPRDHRAGKKISYRDGLLAAWILIKYRFVD